MSRIDIDTRVEDQLAVITPRGELDVAATPLLEEAIAEVRTHEDVLAVVVDLSQLDFIDSSGLRTVVVADQQLRDDGLRFALVPGGEPVQRVFELTRMTERLAWVDDPARALPDAEERA